MEPNGKPLRQLEPQQLSEYRNDGAHAPIEEVIIECGMTEDQKEFGKFILHQNAEYLSSANYRENQQRLLGIFMEMQKVYNHPYLFAGAEQQILSKRRILSGMRQDETMTAEIANCTLIESSGKTILLGKLLNKLKNEGHRVIIFSKMVRMLDILEDMMNFQGYRFERVSGTDSQADTYNALNRFNVEGSLDFAFLLSVRTNIISLNLISADSVIIYDSNLHPEEDFKVASLCHRAWQENVVKMYRLVTENSSESRLIGIKMSTNSSSGKIEMIERMLKYGAYHLFEDNEREALLNAENIEVILRRSLTIRHQGAPDDITYSKWFAKIEEGHEKDSIGDPLFWVKHLNVSNDNREMSAPTSNSRALSP